LISSLLSRARGPVADELRALERLGEMIDALVRKGRAAHPSIPVDEEAWAGHLARHLSQVDVARQLEELHADDVHLVLGCRADSSVALSCLDRRIRAVATQALHRIQIGSLSVEDILQDVRVKLLLGAPGSKKIESYSGRGALDAWLRVTLARTALTRLHGEEEKVAAMSGDDALDELVEKGDDPQIALLRARAAPILKRAIEESLDALPAGSRTLLQLHVVDGLSIDDLAGVYGIHRATVARRAARARSELFEAARVRVIAELGIEEAEFASLVGVLLSRIDLTLHTRHDDAALEG
jgi:RNA polymerase sigma-70 factor (ECF subfamily)